MFTLLVFWLTRRKLRRKHRLEKQEEAALAFIKQHVFSEKRTLCKQDCRVCESDKTWCCGIMMKIPPWVYHSSGSFSYDFNVAFDVIFCKSLVGAYLNQASLLKGFLVLWSIISTCFGFLFWFYRWKTPAYFIHRTEKDNGTPVYTHYSIDAPGTVICHPDREDSVGSNIHNTCEIVSLLFFDEVSQIIISILSLTLLGPLSEMPGFIEWLNIASSMCGFFWYFYSVVDENRYWGSHVMSGPFRLQPQRLVPTSRTLNMIDGLFDGIDEDCKECTAPKEVDDKSLEIEKGTEDIDEEECCCETESDMTLSERTLSFSGEFEA